MAVASTVDALDGKAWYRILQVLRVIAYILLALIAWAGSLGSAPYSFTNTYGQLQSYPGTPFNWSSFFIIGAVGWLLIELTRIGIIYIFAGKTAAAAVGNQLLDNNTKPTATAANHVDQQPSQLDPMTDGQNELFKKTLFAGDWIFEHGVSKDMMAVYTNIALNSFGAFNEKFPDMSDRLSAKEFDSFKALLLEAIGVGYKLYYAERDGSDFKFIRHSGKAFEQYLLKGFQEYFVDNSKNPDDLMPADVFQVAKSLGTLLFNEGFAKKGLFAKYQDEDEMIKSMLIQPMWLVMEGYLLAVLQEEYKVPQKRRL